MLTPAEAIEFRGLIDSPDRRELACGRFLQRVIPTCRDRILSALVTTRHADTQALASANILPIRLETRLGVGRADLQVVVNAADGDNQRVWRCLVWEFKAPQLAAYASQTAVRWGATTDLMDAEEQLLHYVSELRKHGVPLSNGTQISGENISYGGIVMSRDNHVPTDLAEKTLYARAKQIRKTEIHDRVGIQFVNWDYIFNRLTQPAGP